ncbi:MAG: potassium transporter [Bacteroidales bacterium]|nr:potassium transporter [Bacteroidales bacterium]
MAVRKDIESAVRCVRRWRARFAGVVDFGSRAIGVLVFVMSVAVIVALAVYGGFENDAFDKRIVLRLLRWAQGVFVFSILFNLVLRFRRTMTETRFVKRVADVMVLLTLLPALLKTPDSAGGTIIHVLAHRYFLFSALGVFSIAEVSFGLMQIVARRTNPSLILSVSFLFFILIGSFVLMLPRCTHGGISYIDSLFMASSAVSMTGLTPIDAGTTFTPMGWVVIAILMQIGAWGVLTFTSFFSLFFSGRASIYSQLLMRDFVYSKSMGALLPMILYILSFTLVIELGGAVAIYFALPEDFHAPVLGKIGFSVFHSLSAFCNGGFSTLPDGMADPRLFNGNQMIYIVFILLILAGGIGFPNLVNFKEVTVEYCRRLASVITGKKRARVVHPFDVNTRIVLAVTAVLFFGGTAAYFLLEYNNTLLDLPLSKKIVQSAFNVATVRTAGFSTFSPGAWLNVTFMMLMIMTWIGCASQSMGGGVKVNAFAAVVLNLRAIVREQSGVTIFNRTISPASIRRANAVVILSIFAILGFAMIIMVLQPELPLRGVLFESFSAVTTVGLSFGITPQLGAASKIVICAAMFLGRVGIISVLCGIVGNQPDRSDMFPTDDLIIS